MLKAQRNILILILLFSTVILAACSLPSQVETTTPSGDAVATQVSLLLTASPNSTQVPQVVTATPAPTELAPTATILPPTATALATATPTITPTSTEPPQPTSTLSTSDPRATLGEPTFQDTKFKENANWGKAWEDKFTRGKFIDNQMVLTSVGVDGWTLSWPKIDDFYIEMTATTEKCSGMDRYGLIVRAPETFDQGYIFDITCDGHYSLRIWDPEAKDYIDLIPWKHSDAIETGSNKTNRLGLKAEGDQLSLYVNGHLLGNVQDDQYNKGRFGPTIGHTETDDFTIKISEISYWDLK